MIKWIFSNDFKLRVAMENIKYLDFVLNNFSFVVPTNTCPTSSILS